MWERLHRLNPLAYNLLLDGVIFVLVLAVTAPWVAKAAVPEWLLVAFSGTLATRLLLNWR